MTLKITKRLDFPFVCKRLQKRRARKANAPGRLHHHQQQQQQQRSASFSRRAHKSARFFSAVARVFSSSSRLFLSRVFFSFKLLLEEGLVFSCGVPEGPALGARRTKSRYPARTLSRSPGLTISERAEAERAHRLGRVERDRA